MEGDISLCRRNVSTWLAGRPAVRDWQPRTPCMWATSRNKPRLTASTSRRSTFARATVRNKGQAGQAGKSTQSSLFLHRPIYQTSLSQAVISHRIANVAAVPASELRCYTPISPYLVVAKTGAPPPVCPLHTDLTSHTSLRQLLDSVHVVAIGIEAIAPNVQSVVDASDNYLLDDLELLHRLGRVQQDHTGVDELAA